MLNRCPASSKMRSPTRVNSLQNPPKARRTQFVDTHACLLHTVKNRRQWQVDLSIDARDTGLFSLLAQRWNERVNAPQPPRAAMTAPARAARPRRPAIAWRGWG